MNGKTPTSNSSSRITVSLSRKVSDVIYRRRGSINFAIEQGILHALDGCEQQIQVVVITTEQSNDIVRLIRADFDNTTIADWVHVAVSTVEAIRKEMA